MARTSAVLVLTAIAALAAAYACPSAHADTGCSTHVQGSLGVAVCHNPDPRKDHVQLHIECRRWWDPDVDGRPLEIGPAETVTMGDRCWKEIQRIWVTITQGER
ncbi:MAG: hypothetical protein QOF84_3220 [Streptomyces sp.]|nr:hypothetical protein [Streptomyces sp.]